MFLHETLSAGRHRTRISGAISSSAFSADSIRAFLPEDKANTAHSMDKLYALALVNLAAQVGDMHINDIVERSGSMRFTPDILGQHLTGHCLAVMPDEISEQSKLARCNQDLL